MELDASIETVFAFHGNPYNISKISPRWQTVKVEKGDAAPQPGSDFRIAIRFFGLLPMRWHGVWKEIQEPTLLVDEALQSPFAFWRHHHEFLALGSRRTRMTDHVEYLFPGGWLGKWFGETLGRVQFHLMFVDRHARTRRWMRDHG